MRVAIITAEYPPYISGGIGSFAYELSKGLIRRGHDILIVTRAAGIYDRRIEKYTKYSAKYLASPQIPIKDVWFYTLRQADILKTLREAEVDVIHDASGANPFIPWITRLAPTVVTVHGSPQLMEIEAMLGGEEMMRAILFSAPYKLTPITLKPIIKNDIKHWVYVSRFVLKDTIAHIKDHTLRKILLARSSVVYNGVDVQKLRSIKEEVVRSEGIDEESIIFISRLMEYKGVRWLIKTMKLVRAEVNKVKLHIVGDGPLFKDALNLVRKLGLESSVMMHGSQPRDKAMRLLARSVVLVHPSLYEANPYVLAEAYAMGKPVITHKAGYAIELVEETGAGITVNTLNASEFANAIITLLQDKDLYRKLSQKAYEISSLFSLENMVRGYEEVYKRVVQG